MASIMGISIKTVENYRDILFNKFRVNSRLKLVIAALQTGLTDLI